MRLCTLDADINKCIYFSNGKYCIAKDMKCGMIGEDEQKPRYKYVRQTRWYEKYYKK